MADPDAPIIENPDWTPSDDPLRITVRKAPQAEEQGALPKYVREPGSKEIATLIVKGQRFTNWTTVRVEQAWTKVFPSFQFECTEAVPVPLSISGAQFAPGDVVRVLLGGQPAVFGYITERHVGYDKGNHGVRLIGTGDTADLVNSMVPLKSLNGHDGKSVQELAQALSEHLGIAIHTHGNVDGKPFENIQVLPGETPIQAIERYAKMRCIVIGSEATGGLMLIGEHPATTQGYLVEGNNILRANCVVRDASIYKKEMVVGQNKGGDDANGDPQNKQVAERDGSSTRNRHMVVVADVADKQHGIERRADMEVIFTEGSKIEAQITVQGWFKDNNRSDDIWRAGEYYSVTSPSLILYNEVLGCASATYEQNDSGGTTTTLQMVKPQHLNGREGGRSADLAFARDQQVEQQRRANQAIKAGPR